MEKRDGEAGLATTKALVVKEHAESSSKIKKWESEEKHYVKFTFYMSLKIRVVGNY